MRVGPERVTLGIESRYRLSTPCDIEVCRSLSITAVRIFAAPQTATFGQLLHSL